MPSRAKRRLTLVALLVVGGFGSLTSPTAAQLFPPPQPAGNPLTRAKVHLGKALFWEEQLSSTRTVACGTCHIPSAGGEDPRALASPLAVNPGPDAIFGNDDDVLGSPGVPLHGADGLYQWNTHFGLTEQSTGRRTTSALNAGYADELFWDGRAANEFIDPVSQQVVLASGAALESQAVAPITSDVEMAHLARTWAEVITRLEEIEPLALSRRAPTFLLDWIDGRTYQQLFEETFGTPEITAPRVAMAIASYERTQFTNKAPFDAFILGGNVLTPLEAQGETLFRSSSCDRCHTQELMSDNLFHYTGVRPAAEDPGRFDVTADPEDLGKVRTPSLRNLALRAPYMKNGRFATIEEVVEFYDRGGDFDAPNKDTFVRELFLTQQERDAMAAFLKRPLTDPRVAAEHPPFDRPRLVTEDDRLPVIEGAGIAGSGGIVPQPVALEPPVAGNPSFTVGVFDALGGAEALLVIDIADPGLVLPVAGSFAFETVTLGGSGDGAGFGSVSLQIPAAPTGDELFGRWYITDTGTGMPAVTPLIRFSVFPPLSQTLLFVDAFESGNLDDWTSLTP